MAAEGDLAGLPPDRDPGEGEGQRLAGFLRGVARAWEPANASERNKLARKLFATVVVKDATGVAVEARPELAPFFVQTNPRPVNQDGEGCTGGSDGGRFSVFYQPAWPMPDPVPRFEDRTGTQPSMAVAA